MQRSKRALPLVTSSLLPVTSVAYAAAKSTAIPRGFTLIELMITVTIIGILSSIAYPAYTQYLQRGKNAEAMSTLQSLALREEQWYRDNQAYATADQLGIGADGVAVGTRYHTYAVTLNGGSYLLTATGIANQGVGGFTLYLNGLGIGCTAQGASNPLAATGTDCPNGTTRW